MQILVGLGRIIVSVAGSTPGVNGVWAAGLLCIPTPALHE
jgi:hypothetical protein